MILHPVDLAIIGVYLFLMAMVGFLIRNRATRKLDSYFLADRNIPWWMLGLSGCSSYIDIGGTMAMVGALYYLGLKSIWMTHIFWGWLMICFYMAFQAKYIRRSGVMTFAEWNETRFGKTRDAEYARAAAAVFLLVLMVFNLMFIAVGTGKFAEEFLPFGRWQSTLIVFAVVGVYVTLGGFFGVILTDIFQTVLIAVGAVVLGVMAFRGGPAAAVLARKDAAWAALAPTWQLWPAFLADDGAELPALLALRPDPAGRVHLDDLPRAGRAERLGFPVLPDHAQAPRRLARRRAVDGGLHAALDHRLRLHGAGILYLGAEAGFDAEKIMPLVLKKLPLGMQGMFMAVLLAALMSTLSAMINVTSSVVINDFLKRYVKRPFTQRQLVRLGQLASVGALLSASSSASPSRTSSPPGRR